MLCPLAIKKKCQKDCTEAGSTDEPHPTKKKSRSALQDISKQQKAATDSTKVESVNEQHSTRNLKPALYSCRQWSSTGFTDLGSVNELHTTRRILKSKSSCRQQSSTDFTEVKCQSQARQLSILPNAKSVDKLCSNECQKQGYEIVRIQSYSVPLKDFMNDKSTQTTLEDLSVKILDLQKQLNHCKEQLLRKNNALQKLQSENEKLPQELSNLKCNKFHAALEQCLSEHCQRPQINFLLEQLSNVMKQRPTWSADMIRECALFNSISTKAYEHVRNRGLMNLPHIATVQKYLENPQDTGDGITNLSHKSPGNSKGQN